MVPNVYDQFSALNIFKNFYKGVLDEYVDIVFYSRRYFDFEKINQFKLWQNVLMLCEDKKLWCQPDHQDLSVYTFLQCNTGSILQSIEASEDQPASGAKFEKFKPNPENQIMKNSANNISQSICQQDNHILVKLER